MDQKIAKKRNRGRRIGAVLLQEKHVEGKDQPLTLIDGIETRLSYDHAAEILIGCGGVGLVNGKTAYATPRS